jgi:hypothetical protein
MLWIDNPEVLFEPDKLKYYFPGSNMTWQEQANSLVRFIIYLSLFLYLFKGNPMHLIIPPLMMLGIQYYLHKSGKLQSMLVQIFHPSPSGDELASVILNNKLDLNNNNLNNDLNNDLKDQMNNLKNGIVDQETFNLNQLESVRHPMNLHDDANLDNAIDQILNQDMGSEKIGYSKVPIYQDERSPVADVGFYNPSITPPCPGEDECKPPTLENPFGNAMPYDTIEKQVNRACPDEYKKDEKFYNKLFHGIDDLFDRNNSQRQFTTNPSSTRVNDQEAAMQFFYNTPYTEH